MFVAAVSGGMPTQVPELRPAPPSLALPPYISRVTATDRDADADNDSGTILDTFA